MYLSVQKARDLIKHTYRKENEIIAKSKETKVERIGEVDDFSFLKVLKGSKQ